MRSRLKVADWCASRVLAEYRLASTPAGSYAATGIASRHQRSRSVTLWPGIRPDDSCSGVWCGAKAHVAAYADGEASGVYFRTLHNLDAHCPPEPPVEWIS